MPCLTVDQSTGYLYIIYYSRQNFLSGDLTDVYLAVSKNGGLKFDHYKLNDKPFNPNKQVFFGDYIGVSAVNGVIRPIWMELNNAKLSILTALFNDSIASLYDVINSKKEIELINKSIKFEEKINLSLQSKISTKIDVAIYDALKPSSEIVILKNKKIKKGNNRLLIDTKKLNLTKGTYVIFLYYNNTQLYYWILEE
jgi:hypothetical protein